MLLTILSRTSRTVPVSMNLTKLFFVFLRVDEEKPPNSFSGGFDKMLGGILSVPKPNKD